MVKGVQKRMFPHKSRRRRFFCMRIIVKPTKIYTVNPLRPQSVYRFGTIFYENAEMKKAQVRLHMIVLHCNGAYNNNNNTTSMVYGSGGGGGGGCPKNSQSIIICYGSGTSNRLVYTSNRKSRFTRSPVVFNAQRTGLPDYNLM